MGGKSTTQRTTAPLLGTLKVQTSMYGLAVPLAWGQPRVQGNLVWFGNFIATAHTKTTTQGGKGGGGGSTQIDTKYTYSAAAVLALCRGPISGIGRAWRGKRRFDGTYIPEHTVQRVTTASVPAAGPYTIDVALSGGTFANVVSVVKLVGTTYDTGDSSTGFGYVPQPLYSPADWTRSSTTFTFDASLAESLVTITWLELMPEAVLSAIDELGLSVATGLVGQPVWPWLASYKPAEALAYSGAAYLYASDYPLTTNAEIENHNFELITGRQVGEGIVDAWPKEIIYDFLTSSLYGLGWPAARLAPLTQFENYTRARSLWLSVAMSAQRAAREWMDDLAQVCNSEWVWQAGQLDLIPRGDEAVSSAWGTYTPDTTPLFDLRHGEGGDILEPVEVEPIINEDAHNIIRIEWTNRTNDYTVEVMEARDAAHIELFGERPAKVLQLHAIHTPEVAQSVCQQLLQREMSVWNRYKFEVPYSRALIGLMSLVTLTDADSALNRVPVRITGRREARGDLRYEYSAEDAPIGSASAPVYGAQGGSGYAFDFNADPGSVAEPVFLEAPVEMAAGTAGLEVWIAVTGVKPEWGGCQVWISQNGVDYKQAGVLYGGARYGQLTSALAAEPGGSLAVQLVGQGGQLLSADAADAEQLATLCWVSGGVGMPGEFLAYEEATLTGTNAYTLDTLQRGVYSTTGNAAATGTRFVRCDQAVFRSGALEESAIGSTLFVKFCSFNPFGGALQSLDQVLPYSYTISGAMLLLPPADVTGFLIDGNLLSWQEVASADVANGGGYRIRYQRGQNTNWDTAAPLHVGLITDSPHDMVAPPSGEVTLLIKAEDRYGVLSEQPAVIYTTLDAHVVANVVESYDLQAAGWPGTLTDFTESGGDLEADPVTSMYPSDSGASMYPADSGAPMYLAIVYAAGEYVTEVWLPTQAWLGATMSVELDIAAASWTLDYRLVGAAPMYPTESSDPMYPADSGDPMYSGSTDWLPMPAFLTVTSAAIQWRLRTAGGSVQGIVSGFTVVLDVPTRTESYGDVAVTAPGSYVAAAANVFTHIASVQVTTQGATTAAYPDATNGKNTELGPLINAASNCLVDVTITGY